MTAVSLRLPDQTSKRLDRLAKLTGRSKTYYMIEAINEHLEDIEDLYIAEQRLKAHHNDNTDSVALEDVMKRYGLES